MCLPGQVQRLIYLSLSACCRRCAEGLEISDQAITRVLLAAAGPAGCSRPGGAAFISSLSHIFSAVAPASGMDQRLPIPGRPSWLWVVGILANKQAPELLGALLAPGEAGLAVPVARHPSWNRDSLLAPCPELADQLSAAADLLSISPGRRCTGCASIHASRQSAPAAARRLWRGWFAVSAGQPARWRRTQQHGRA